MNGLSVYWCRRWFTAERAEADDKDCRPGFIRAWHNSEFTFYKRFEYSNFSINNSNKIIRLNRGGTYYS